MVTATPVGAPILAQRIDSSLHAKVWRLGRPHGGIGRVLVFIEDGAARLETDAEVKHVTAPALLWLADPAGARLIAEAGTVGYVAEIAEDIIVRAVGDFLESAALRFMVDRDLEVALVDQRESTRISACLATITEETQTPRTGMQMMLVANLRQTLVTMMRLSGSEAMLGAAGSSAHFLQRFRQLVEGHFRTHWPVARYAEILGISHDRLHAICQRELGKTPKALLAERLAREASLALERSTLTIEQLSYSLGFRDAAYFSHFFKRMTGIPPGQFRRTMTRAAPGGQNATPITFADWP